MAAVVGQSDPPIPIMRDDRVHPEEAGIHSVDFESGNGIQFQMSGQEGENGGANMVGKYR